MVFKSLRVKVKNWVWRDDVDATTQRTIDVGGMLWGVLYFDVVEVKKVMVLEVRKINK